MAAPVILLVLLYAALVVTPIPLPFVSSQVRNVVLSMMPEGSQLELGDMALALEGYVWPVIRFSPVTFTDVKTGGMVRMEALEVGFSPVRAVVGQPGATVTIVGPHLQVNQDLFGPRLAKFELIDEADGSRTVRVIEGEDLQVLDARNGEDITRSILLMVVAEQRGEVERLLDVGFLRELIRSGISDDLRKPGDGANPPPGPASA